jgi:hypothetical protein
MATQPASNGSQIQIIPLSEACKNEERQTRYQYVLDELEKAPRETGLKLQFRSRYLACQCAIGLRSLINWRALDIGIRQKQDAVFVWKLQA